MSRILCNCDTRRAQEEWGSLVGVFSAVQSDVADIQQAVKHWG